MTEQISRARRAGLAGLVCLAALLGACTPSGFPDDPLEQDRPDLDYPQIAPLAPILDLMEPELPDAENPDPELSARGDVLRASTQAQSGAAATEAELSERGAALRERATEIRAAAP